MAMLESHTFKLINFINLNRSLLIFLQMNSMILPRKMYALVLRDNHSVSQYTGAVEI